MPETLTPPAPAVARGPGDLRFTYVEAGIALHDGRPLPPYIDAIGTDRLPASATADIPALLAEACDYTRERWAAKAHLIASELRLETQSLSLAEMIDEILFTLFPERRETHVHLKGVRRADIERLLERHGCEFLEGGREAVIQRLTSGRRLRIKFGIDPTGGALHQGHGVPLRLINKLARMGHDVAILVGTFTAKIGDPSGRSKLRPALTDEDIRQNIQGYQDQIRSILDPAIVRWVFNGDWLANLSLAQCFPLFAGLSARQFYERDFVQSRQEKGVAVGLHDLLYSFLQGYDSVHLKADLAVSGRDQLFNERQGARLQEACGQPPQGLLMLPLLAGTDGTKMSKTANNCIPLRMPPNEMFEQAMRVNDSLILDYLRYATNVPLAVIDNAAQQLAAGRNPRDVKLTLALAMVAELYDEATAAAAERHFVERFTQRTAPVDLPQVEIARGAHSVLRLLFDSGIASSTSAARRYVEDRGVKVDSAMVEDSAAVITVEAPIVLQFGRHKMVRLVPASVS